MTTSLGNYQGLVTCAATSDCLPCVGFSKRLAHFDHIERFSNPPWRQPGDRSSRCGARAAQAHRRHPWRSPPLPARGHRGVRGPSRGKDAALRPRQLERSRSPPGGQPADGEPGRSRRAVASSRRHAGRSSALFPLGDLRLALRDVDGRGGENLMAGNGSEPHTVARAVPNPLAVIVLLQRLAFPTSVLVVVPIVAILRGIVELVTEAETRTGAEWVGYGFAFTGLFLGAI